MTAKRHKQSPETIAKRVASIKARRLADPDKEAERKVKAAAGIRRWRKDPANAVRVAELAELSGERMKRRHADPEWQKVRDKRSSRTMTETWKTHREKFVAGTVERYGRMAQEGTGICSEQSKERKAIAAKWIMKRAQEALHTETNYCEVYAEVQAMLRREMPYDGPQDNSEYMDYLQRLGRSTVASPELQEIAKPFLSAAIPRFAKEWQARAKEVCNRAEEREVRGKEDARI